MSERKQRFCPACESAGGRSVGSKNGFEVLVCSDCQTIFTSSLPEIEKTENYDEYYTDANLQVPEFITRRVGEIIGGFSEYRQTNRLLDIGFGAGTILQIAAGQKWEPFGIEVSRPAVEQARKAGFEVHHGDLADAAYPDGYFDVI